MRKEMKKTYDIRDEEDRKNLKIDTDHLSLMKARFSVEALGFHKIIVSVSCNKNGVVKEICDRLHYS